MARRVACPQCQTFSTIPDNLQNRSVRIQCGKCGKSFVEKPRSSAASDRNEDSRSSAATGSGGAVVLFLGLFLVGALLIVGGSGAAGYFLFFKKDSSTPQVAQSTPTPRQNEERPQQPTPDNKPPSDPNGRKPTDPSRPPDGEKPQPEPEKPEPAKPEPVKPVAPEVKPPDKPEPTPPAKEPVVIKTEKAIQNLIRTPDGQTMVAHPVSFIPSEREIQLLEYPSGKVTTVHKRQDFAVQAMAVTPDGKTLILGGMHDQFPPPPNREHVQLFDLQTGAKKSGLPGMPAAARAMALSADGSLLAVGLSSPEHTVYVWDLRTAQSRYQFQQVCKTQINALAFSPDGKYLVAGCLDGGGTSSMTMWGMEVGKMIRAVKDLPGRLEGMAISADSKTVAAAFNHFQHGTVMAWDLQLGQGRWSAATRAARNVIFGPEDRTLAVACYDNSMHVLAAADGKELGGFRGHGGPVDALFFSRDGKTLVTGCLGDRTIRLWDYASPQQLNTPKDPISQGPKPGEKPPPVGKPAEELLTFNNAEIERWVDNYHRNIVADGKKAMVILNSSTKYFDADGKPGFVARISKVGNIVQIKAKKQFAIEVLEMRLVKEAPRELSLAKVKVTATAIGGFSLEQQGKQLEVEYDAGVRVLDVNNKEVERPNLRRLVRLGRVLDVKVRYSEGASLPLVAEIRLLEDLPEDRFPGIRIRVFKDARLIAATIGGKPRYYVENPKTEVRLNDTTRALDQEGKPVPVEQFIKNRTRGQIIVHDQAGADTLLEVRALEPLKP